MNDIDNVNQDTLKQSILKDLHKQFAENQNSQKKLLVSLLVIILSLVGGLGFIYTHLETSVVKHYVNDIIILKPFVLHQALVISVILLGFICMLVVDLGWSFRRDQKLNDKIRKSGMNDCDYNEFFGNYGKNIENMPDFYRIFFWFIFGFQVLFLVFAWSHFCCNCQINSNIDCFILFSTVVAIALMFVEIFYNNFRKQKLNKKD